MKKGVSLIALLVTISVIIILTSVITVTGTSIYNNNKKVKFASELSYVQELVDTYKKNNNGNYPASKLINVDISNVLQTDNSNQFNNELITEDNHIFLYKIDFSYLNTNRLIYQNNDSDSQDIYCVSSTTGKVYYIKGLKIGRNIYFTLTDELKKIINYVEENNVNDGILFIYNDEYNNNGNIDIKIPLSYTDISVISTDGNFNSIVENEKEYVVYKTTSAINSVITVRYRKNVNSEIKQIKYTVNNLDKEAPNFDISEIQTLINSDTGKEEKYIKIENLKDTLSGIKKIKYANLKIHSGIAEKYFVNSGIDLNDNIIKINENINFITVYVEDNAGNFSIKTVKIKDNAYTDYIQSDLILCLDGIENTRKGHNEKTTIWEDLSGKEKDCNLINFSYDEESGWGKNGLIFDGNDDGVYLDNKLKDLFKEDFSIEFLLSCDEQNTRDVLMGNYSVSQNINFENYYNSFRLYWNGGEINYIGTNVLFEKDILKYICITLDKEKGILKIYENGKLFDTITNSKLSSYNYDYINAYIGRDNRTGTTSFKGIINSVRIYTKQLIQEEIEHNYKIDKIRFEI